MNEANFGNVGGELVRSAVVHADLVGEGQREPHAVLVVDAHGVRVAAAGLVAGSEYLFDELEISACRRR